MLEKIDKFIDKYLNWKVWLNLLWAELCTIPFYFFASMCNVPRLFRIIMILSIGISLSFIRKAVENVKRED